MTNDILSYIQRFLTHDTPLLDELEAETARRPNTSPTIGIGDGLTISLKR